MQCEKVFYCGVDCQRGDWSRHKVECVPPRAADSKDGHVALSGMECKTNSPLSDPTPPETLIEGYKALSNSCDRLKQMYSNLTSQAENCVELGVRYLELGTLGIAVQVRVILMRLRESGRLFAAIERVREEIDRVFETQSDEMNSDPSLSVQISDLQKTVNAQQKTMDEMLRELSSLSDYWALLSSFDRLKQTLSRLKSQIDNCADLVVRYSEVGTSEGADKAAAILSKLREAQQLTAALKGLSESMEKIDRMFETQPDEINSDLSLSVQISDLQKTVNAQQEIADKILRAFLSTRLLAQQS